MYRTNNAETTFSRYFNVLLFSILLVSISAAQITIPPSGLSNLLTAGTSFNGYKSDTAPRTLNIGKRGGPAVYDFSNYSYEQTVKSNVYSVGAIPMLAARYPAKALVFGDSPQTIENNPIFLFGTDTLFVLGQASLVQQPRFLHIRPYEAMAIFPITYGGSRTYTHMHYDTTYNASGAMVSTNSYSGSDSASIDGYGTLKILGRQFECLRVRLKHYTFSDKEFIFFTREGVFMDVMMASSQPDTGVVQPQSVMLLVPSSITSAGQEVLLPTSYRLDQNYPNPFNPRTTISYQLPTASLVSLRVFDILGRLVSTLVSGSRPAGAHVIQWDGNNEKGEPMPSGVYLYQLSAGSSEVTKKMILLK